MKLIDSDKAYEILDRLFSRIQKNEYQANQQMLDDVWKEWCNLPTAYDVNKVVERLGDEYINCFTTGDYKYNNAIDKAIEIVKDGGVNG